MFYSRINRDQQAIIGEVTSAWKCRSFSVACSPDFLLERILYARHAGPIVSNDVSLYAHALGAYLAGSPLTLRLRPEAESTLGWLVPFLETPEDTVATALLSGDLLTAMDRPDAYHARMFHGYRSQWPALHAKVVSRLSECDLRLSAFHAMDVQTFVTEAPKDAGLLCCPGSYRGAEATLLRRYSETFTWDLPPHTVPDAEGLTALYEAIRDRPYWLLSLPAPRPELEGNLCGVVRATNQSVPYYIYAGTRLARRVQPAQPCEPIAAPRLLPGEEIGERLTVSVLRQAQFNTLRSQYLNASIAPSQPRFALAICVDGRIIGGLAFKTDDRGGYPGMILLSDFPVSPTDYPRLSKLIVAAALSCEVKLLCERCVGKRVDHLRTIVYTNNAVSMKYRGLFEQVSSLPTKGGPFERQLTYTANTGRWTLQEALAHWKAQWGDRKAQADADLD